MAAEQSTFRLHSSHQRSRDNFQSRSDDVFGSLGSLEKKYDDGVKNREPDLSLEDESRDEEKRNDDRESTFKRPGPPSYRNGRSGGDHGGSGSKWRPGRNYSSRREGHHSGGNKRHGTPDYKIHPEKWTKYTLEDTDLSSHSANKRAAIDFLRDLRERKTKDSDAGESSGGVECGKIEFKKPVAKTSEEEEVRKKNPSSDVHKMPEYVIGQTKRKRKSNAPSSSTGVCTSESIISLGHLEEEADIDQGKYKMKRVLDAKTDAPSTSDQSVSKTASAPSKSGQSEERGGDSGGTIDQSDEVSSSGAVNVKEGGGKQSMMFQKKKGKRNRQIRGRGEEETE